MRAIALVCLFAMALSLTGCPIRYEAKLDELLDKRPYKKSEKEVAKYSSYKIIAVEDGSGGATINKKIVTPAMMTSVAKDMRDYLQIILDPTHDFFGPLDSVYHIRPKIEKMVLANQCRYARFRAFELHQQFTKVLGADAQKGQDVGFDITTYDPRILLIKNLDQVLPFKSIRIEKARTEKILKEMRSVRVHEKGIFGELKPLTDKYDYDWLDEDEGYVLKMYKIVESEATLTDINGDYLEIYRLIPKTNKIESMPAIKAFLDGSRGKALVLVDYDFNGDIGYGLPDELLEIEEEKIVQQDILQKITKNRFTITEKIESDKPVVAEIVKVGAPELTEESAVGFSIPRGFSADNKNYHVRIGYASPDKTVRYIMKQYHKEGEEKAKSDGLIFAYFKPKVPYDKGIVEAKVLFGESTKKISIESVDGSIVEGSIMPGDNKFIHAKPYRIDYTDSAGIRYAILDQNEDGVFEGRMLVSEGATDDVGLYDDKNNSGTYPVP